MPNVCSIGGQSARREGIRGGWFATDLNPSAVSRRPRRSNQPTIQKITLATKGIRQPQATTSPLLSRALASHADPEPRINPIVTPAAVELLMRPRVIADADSVVYTMDPVNSPPTEKPCIKRMVTSNSGAAKPIC